MIEFKDLVKKFGQRTVLDKISLKVDQGQIVFILGTSGTGKSVLLKNIVGLLRPDFGQIWIDNQEVSNFSEDQFGEIRRKCGMVFQQPALFDSLTVFENVAFGLRRQLKLSDQEITARVQDALSLVHVDESQISRFPQQISYGTQKRVSLARTLAVRPKILLFDEPTTGLDPVTTNAINNLILELSRKLKTTSIVVSHDMNCALAIADRIVVLDQGKILQAGTPDQLRKSTTPLVQEFLAEAIANEGQPL